MCVTQNVEHNQPSAATLRYPYTGLVTALCQSSALTLLYGISNQLLLPCPAVSAIICSYLVLRYQQPSALTLPYGISNHLLLPCPTVSAIICSYLALRYKQSSALTLTYGISNHLLLPCPTESATRLRSSPTALRLASHLSCNQEIQCKGKGRRSRCGWPCVVNLRLKSFDGWVAGSKPAEGLDVRLLCLACVA
jgi:hypothetical protein